MASEFNFDRRPSAVLLNEGEIFIVLFHSPSFPDNLTNNVCLTVLKFIENFKDLSKTS